MTGKKYQLTLDMLNSSLLTVTRRRADETRQVFIDPPGDKDSRFHRAFDQVDNRWMYKRYFANSVKYYWAKDPAYCSDRLLCQPTIRPRQPVRKKQV